MCQISLSTHTYITCLSGALTSVNLVAQSLSFNLSKKETKITITPQWQVVHGLLWDVAMRFWCYNLDLKTGINIVIPNTNPINLGEILREIATQKLI